MWLVCLGCIWGLGLYIYLSYASALRNSQMHMCIHQSASASDWDNRELLELLPAASPSIMYMSYGQPSLVAVWDRVRELGGTPYVHPCMMFPVLINEFENGRIHGSVVINSFHRCIVYHIDTYISSIYDIDISLASCRLGFWSDSIHEWLSEFSQLM